jgi:hypothetical protein
MNKVSISVDSRVELVQIIIYLCHQQSKTIQCIFNDCDYIKQINMHFSEFEKHEAVLLTSNLITNNNFIHIRPLRAILNINKIVNEPENHLYKWALAVKEFEIVTKFLRFYDENKRFYNMIIEKYASYFSEKWIEYIERFFKQTFGSYNIIGCPLAGNYGFMIDVPNPQSAYVVNNQPWYDKDTGEIHWVSKGQFAKNLAHEFAHCFVNPVVEKYSAELEQMNNFFNAHKNIPYAYNVRYAVINEYFVRAFAIKLIQNFKSEFEDFDIKQEVDRQREMFIFLDEFILMLNEYEKSLLTFESYYLSVINKISKMV